MESAEDSSSASIQSDPSDFFLDSESLGADYEETHLKQTLQDSIEAQSSSIKIQESIQSLYRFYQSRSRFPEAEGCLLQLLTLWANQHSDIVLETLSELVHFYKKQPALQGEKVKAEVNKLLKDFTFSTSFHWKVYEFKALLRGAWNSAARCEKSLKKLSSRLLSCDFERWEALQHKRIECMKRTCSLGDYRTMLWEVFAETRARFGRSERATIALNKFAITEERYWFPGPTSDLRRNRLIEGARYLHSIANSPISVALQEVISAHEKRPTSLDLCNLTDFLALILQVVLSHDLQQPLGGVYSKLGDAVSTLGLYSPAAISLYRSAVFLFEKQRLKDEKKQSCYRLAVIFRGLQDLSRTELMAVRCLSNCRWSEIYVVRQARESYRRS